MDTIGRRGLLRGLATLPLIGGSVALIGNPTRADVPVTPELQERYIAWLANEHAAALFEHGVAGYRSRPEMNRNWHEARVRVPLYWFPKAPDIERMTAWTLPSARAAIVLSAVGCPLG